MRLGLPVLILLAACRGVSKVPITDVEASFSLADVSWFDEEDTLFVFYQASAQQGIGDPTVVEIRYTTDDEVVDWTPLENFEPVHTHVAASFCPDNSVCGSMSLRVPIEPRNVRVRLRYHRDGELALDAPTVFNVVGPGPAHTHRSALVYGVFNERNERVQWRLRHRFPTLRNQRASQLGLRRDLVVRDQRYGGEEIATADNPYGYDAGCPGSYTATTIADTVTDERAAFSPDDLPLAASDAPTVCAETTLTDANGTFVAPAIARKNPEIRPAFPVLRSPITEAVLLKFFLEPCDRIISPLHEQMQRQRTQTEGVESICIDDWDQPTFVPSLVATFREAIEAARVDGRDLALVIGLHRNDPGVAVALESALVEILPDERHRTSPRVVGGFVFDSVERNISRPALSPVVLWCPATLIGGDTSSISCPVLPDFPLPNLGPLDIGVLPILPTREEYIEFITDFSDAQAGSVETFTLRTPEFTPTTDHIDFGQFGVATFLNGETITADADDAFSFCQQEDFNPVVFRSNTMSSDIFRQSIAGPCAFGALPPEICAVPETGLLQLNWIPDWHNQVRESDYELGLFWDFPFLLQLEYRAVVGASLTGFGVSVPFGFGSDAETYYGSQVWRTDAFPLDPQLEQCTRFCNHPTFDGAGVFNVLSPFRTTYANACYLPIHPEVGDPGFPIDP